MAYGFATCATLVFPFFLAFTACNQDLAAAQNGLDGAAASEAGGQGSNSEAGGPGAADSSISEGATGGLDSGGSCAASAVSPVSPDAAACFIDLNQYDRSCSVDSDCVSTVVLSCAVYQGSRPVPAVYVRGGNFCDGCNCNGGFAINQRAVPQYIASLSATPQGSGQAAFPVCNCPASPPPGTLGCINGTCGFYGGSSDAGFSE